MEMNGHRHDLKLSIAPGESGTYFALVGFYVSMMMTIVHNENANSNNFSDHPMYVPNQFY